MLVAGESSKPNASARPALPLFAQDWGGGWALIAADGGRQVGHVDGQTPGHHLEADEERTETILVPNCSLAAVEWHQKNSVR